ncbi:MAG TPA: hypothetical protein VGZ00_00060 [Candidatus Baltobacteraceae bacterium]|jgi:hypothetical protein|nr:hypothetical protein [Candidatus Baltobacteraceae bacterium]
MASKVHGPKVLFMKKVSPAKRLKHDLDNEYHRETITAMIGAFIAMSQSQPPYLPPSTLPAIHGDERPRSAPRLPSGTVVILAQNAPAAADFTSAAPVAVYRNADFITQRELLLQTFDQWLKDNHIQASQIIRLDCMGGAIFRSDEATGGVVLGFIRDIFQKPTATPTAAPYEITKVSSYNPNPESPRDGLGALYDLPEMRKQFKELFLGIPQISGDDVTRVKFSAAVRYIIPKGRYGYEERVAYLEGVPARSPIEKSIDAQNIQDYINQGQRVDPISRQGPRVSATQAADSRGPIKTIR